MASIPRRASLLAPALAVLLLLVAASGAGADTLAGKRVSAARGGVVRAPGGFELRIGPHVMRRDGRATIVRTGPDIYNFHISAPWRGLVTVVMPITGDPPIIAHRVLGEWRIEPARVIHGRAVVRVRKLSLFSDVVKCLKPGSIQSRLLCFVGIGVKKLPETIAKKLLSWGIPDADPCKDIMFSINILDLLKACEGAPDPPVGQPPAPATPTPTTPAPAAPAPAAPAPTIFNATVYGTCDDGACGLFKRPEPKYSTPENRGSVGDGTMLAIQCQIAGELVTPGDGRSTNVWNRLTDQTYVSDAYVATPSTRKGFSATIPRC